jgi:hypothetical protein
MKQRRESERIRTRRELKQMEGCILLFLQKKTRDS